MSEIPIEILETLAEKYHLLLSDELIWFANECYNIGIKEESANDH